MMIPKINKYFDKKIVIGVSSGVDSMVLFDLLKKHNIIVAHINHNIRPESEYEQTYLRDYCLQCNVPFETITLEYSESEREENFQLIARNKRYEFYKRVIDKYDADLLALAHHGDDLVETILMSMTRGTSLRGLIGFGEESQFGSVMLIRPLIKHSKEELIDYAEQHEIIYFEDASNKSDKYTRNRYRNEILPFLQKETKNIHQKYLNMSEDLTDIHSYLMIAVDNYINSDRSVSEFQTLHKAVQKEIVATLLKRQSISFNCNLINEIVNILTSDEPNSEIHLPNNLIVLREYDKFTIQIAQSNTSYDIEISDFGTYVLPNGDEVSITEKKSDFHTHSYKLCYNDLVFPIRVRNRQNGDKMKLPFGTKKLKSLFIDLKIPLKKRDLIPIILHQDDIVWIPGIKKRNIEGSKHIFINYQKGDYYG